MDIKDFKLPDLNINELKSNLQAIANSMPKKPIEVQPVYFPRTDFLAQNVNFPEPILPDDYKSPGEYLEEIQQKQDAQIGELKKANDELIKTNQCLVEQNENLKQQNIENTKLMKKQKIWNWITFSISTVIAIAGVVIAIIALK